MLNIDDINNTDGLPDFLPEGKEYPDVVPGRVAHLDADFLAYYASYEREGENRSLEDMQLSVNTMLHDLRKSCGAATAVCHLTPESSGKAGRYDKAIQKAYQSGRSGDKPRLLGDVRNYISVIHRYFPDTLKGVYWWEAEADDGMAGAAWDAYAAGTPELCVIASKDKDLRIPPGLHYNFDTGEIEGAEDTFGYIEKKTTVKISETTGKKSTTHKPRGYGTKFFWWQMLMGDQADSIVGIPRAGIVKAYDMLADCKNDYDCLQVVKAAYKEHGESKGFLHWDTKDPVEWSKVFISEAQLLWMQRTPGDIDDVKHWMKEVIKNGKR
jgi:DNA polymerase-1